MHPAGVVTRAAARDGRNVPEVEDPCSDGELVPARGSDGHDVAGTSVARRTDGALDGYGWRG